MTTRTRMMKVIWRTTCRAHAEPHVQHNNWPISVSLIFLIVGLMKVLLVFWDFIHANWLNLCQWDTTVFIAFWSSWALTILHWSNPHLDHYEPNSTGYYHEGWSQPTCSTYFPGESEISSALPFLASMHQDSVRWSIIWAKLECCNIVCVESWSCYLVLN